MKYGMWHMAYVPSAINSNIAYNTEPVMYPGRLIKAVAGVVMTSLHSSLRPIRWET